MKEYIYDILDDKENIIIYDPTQINWNKFIFKRGYFEHYITQKDIERIDLLSFNYYGNVDYWDIILLINNIDNIFSVRTGSIIKIPHLQDIKDFIQNKGEV